MKRLDRKSEKGKKWKWRERVKEMKSNIIDGYKRRVWLSESVCMWEIGILRGREEIGRIERVVGIGSGK